MPNFWTQLNKPIFCLAPMEEVTDVAFREMFAKYGKQVTSDKLQVTRPNNFVMYTEFVNVDGLTHPEGYKKLSLDLKFTQIQRPMVAQIWGNNPEKFFEAAQIVAKMGFDGIDINMGCPQDKEIGIGACAALIREPALAGKIIEATIKGGGGLPVSVKTRLGYSKTDEMEGWVSHLLSFNIAALALHARTKQEKSKVAAHWEKIKEAVELRNQIQSGVIARSRFVSQSSGDDEAILPNKKIASPRNGQGARNDTVTLIIGNGDIKSRAEGLMRIAETGCDGVMAGRGAFGNPWFFRADNHQPSIKERLSVMLEHAALFEKEFAGIKSFFVMRKHFKAYASGFDGAHELRAKLMEAKNLEETQDVVTAFLSTI